jgi:hypothetical protein
MVPKESGLRFPELDVSNKFPSQSVGHFNKTMAKKAIQQLRPTDRTLSTSKYSIIAVCRCSSGSTSSSPNEHVAVRFDCLQNESDPIGPGLGELSQMSLFRFDQGWCTSEIDRDWTEPFEKAIGTDKKGIHCQLLANDGKKISNTLYLPEPPMNITPNQSPIREVISKETNMTSITDSLLLSYNIIPMVAAAINLTEHCPGSHNFRVYRWFRIFYLPEAPILITHRPNQSPILKGQFKREHDDICPGFFALSNNNLVGSGK